MTLLKPRGLLPEELMNNEGLVHFTEKNLLENHFEKPILLVTYKGNVLVKQKIDVYNYDHKIDKQKTTPKLQVLFAFQFTDFEAISIGIKLNQKIEDQKLKPIKKRSQRPLVATQKEYNNGTDQNVKITMRTGHVLSGYQLQATEHNLVLRISDKHVLVYKHGILEYHSEGETQNGK